MKVKKYLEMKWGVCICKYVVIIKEIYFKKVFCVFKIIFFLFFFIVIYNMFVKF